MTITITTQSRMFFVRSFKELPSGDNGPGSAGDVGLQARYTILKALASR
jgi:hypothetical protein